MVTVEQIFSYLEQSLAEATLQADQNEIRQIQQVTSFISGLSPKPVTSSQLTGELEHQIARAIEHKQPGVLADLQVIAGYLMRPAEAHKDRELARQLRILAARARNAIEQIEQARER